MVRFLAPECNMEGRRWLWTINLSDKEDGGDATKGLLWLAQTTLYFLPWSQDYETRSQFRKGKYSIEQWIQDCRTEGLCRKKGKLTSVMISYQKVTDNGPWWTSDGEKTTLLTHFLQVWRNIQPLHSYNICNILQDEAHVRPKIGTWRLYLQRCILRRVTH
jgi:hypothetical protein